MKLKILAFVAVMAMSVSGPANAATAFFTGGKILSACESNEVVHRNYCIMYLSGVGDAHIVLEVWGEVPLKQICFPEKTSLQQIRRVFIKFANDNPQGLHLGAASMVLAAFRKAFPCGES